MAALKQSISYSPLDSSHQSIRLIELLPATTHSSICCNLHYVRLDSQPEYLALSYKWGPRTRSWRPIWLDGRLCHVRSWLWAMLQQFRDESKTQKLWIDALCIDQSNVAERNHQVHLMGKIYSCATRVLVWLGNQDEGSEIAFSFMENLTAEDDHLSGSNKDPVPTPVSNALSLICYRPYWFRAWIRQEIILAKDIEVLCGPHRVSWKVFVYVCSQMSSIALSGSPVRQLIRQQALEPKQKLDKLQNLLTKYGHSQCTDIRDRVYALLSLASDCVNDSGFQADYSLDCTGLYQSVMRFCCPTDADGFGSTLGDILDLNNTQIQRIQDLNNLRSRYGQSVDMRFSLKELESFATCYSDTHQRTKYLQMKAAFIWEVISAHDPLTPIRFQELYEGEHDTDPSSETENSRARAFQDLIDNLIAPHILQAVVNAIYPSLVKTTRAIGTTKLADAESKEAATRVYCNVMLLQRKAADYLVERRTLSQVAQLPRANWHHSRGQQPATAFQILAFRLEEVLSIKEVQRLTSGHIRLLYISNNACYRKARDRMYHYLSVKKACLCSWPKCCPIDEAAIACQILTAVWDFIGFNGDVFVPNILPFTKAYLQLSSSGRDWSEFQSWLQDFQELLCRIFGLSRLQEEEQETIRNVGKQFALYSKSLESYQDCFGSHDILPSYLKLWGTVDLGCLMSVIVPASSLEIFSDHPYAYRMHEVPLSHLGLQPPWTKSKRGSFTLRSSDNELHSVRRVLRVDDRRSQAEGDSALEKASEGDPAFSYDEVSNIRYNPTPTYGRLTPPPAHHRFTPRPSDKTGPFWEQDRRWFDRGGGPEL